MITTMRVMLLKDCVEGFAVIYQGIIFGAGDKTGRNSPRQVVVKHAVIRRFAILFIAQISPIVIV